jgi:hypothetical protein
MMAITIFMSAPCPVPTKHRGIFAADPKAKTDRAREARAVLTGRCTTKAVPTAFGPDKGLI